MDSPQFSQRFGILLESYLKGCGEAVFVSCHMIVTWLSHDYSSFVERVTTTTPSYTRHYVCCCRGMYPFNNAMYPFNRTMYPFNRIMYPINNLYIHLVKETHR